jgi:hypothetical protein
MLQRAVSYGSGADNERAIGDGFGECGELL